MKTIETWALHAYVDGELDAADRAAVERLLQDDPQAGRLVECYRRQKDAMKQAYDGVLSELPPPSMRAALATRGSWRDTPFFHMAAAVALLLLGGLAGWAAGREEATAAAETVAADALTAHAVYASEVRHPVEVLGSEKQHLEAWLSKRVGVSFTIPDLTEEGYALLGGRLSMSGGHAAALLMYEDSHQRRITIFLAPSEQKSETALRVETRGPLIACYWLDGKLSFAMAGEMDREPMMQLARIVYDKFEG